MLSKEVSSTIFNVFGTTRPWIEPRVSKTLANTRPPYKQYIIGHQFSLMRVWLRRTDKKKGYRFFFLVYAVGNVNPDQMNPLKPLKKFTGFLGFSVLSLQNSRLTCATGIKSKPLLHGSHPVLKVWFLVLPNELTPRFIYIYVCVYVWVYVCVCVCVCVSIQSN